MRLSILDARYSMPAILAALLFSFHAEAQGGGCGKIDFYCTSDGQAHGMVKGKRITIDCGASTKSKSGVIQADHACSGVLTNGTKTCLKGKPCKHMDGAKKLHMTSCGTGAKPASGLLKTRGCVVFGKEDYQLISSCVGSPFQVHAGNRKNGR